MITNKDNFKIMLEVRLSATNDFVHTLTDRLMHFVKDDPEEKKNLEIITNSYINMADKTDQVLIDFIALINEQKSTAH